MLDLHNDLSKRPLNRRFNPVVHKWLWAEQLLNMYVKIMYIDWVVAVVKNSILGIDGTYDL